jgi:hypothetical protein
VVHLIAEKQQLASQRQMDKIVEKVKFRGRGESELMK